MVEGNYCDKNKNKNLKLSICNKCPKINNMIDSGNNEKQGDGNSTVNLLVDNMPSHLQRISHTG